MTLCCFLQKPHLYELKGDLPGIREEEVKLSVDGDVLSISVENVGKAKEETKEEVRFVFFAKGAEK